MALFPPLTALPVVARLHTYFTLGGFASCIALACASQPGDVGGSGGTPGPSSGGTSPGSGGQPSSGGTGTGGASTGGISSGGSGSGSDAEGGLGGETATGGGEASGGADGVGGSGGTPAAGYAECDEDVSSENNPACAGGEVCVDNVCTETCPTDLNDAAVYACPESPGGEALSQCSFVFGQCRLVCESQSGQEYTCPDGMVCDFARCIWPE